MKDQIAVVTIEVHGVSTVEESADKQLLGLPSLDTSPERLESEG